MYEVCGGFLLAIVINHGVPSAPSHKRHSPVREKGKTGFPRSKGGILLNHYLDESSDEIQQGMWVVGHPIGGPRNMYSMAIAAISSPTTLEKIDDLVSDDACNGVSVSHEEPCDHKGKAAR